MTQLTAASGPLAPAAVVSGCLPGVNKPVGLSQLIMIITAQIVQKVIHDIYY